jgi:hypothetical protein
MANKNDERILQLREQIKAKKEKIGKVGRFTAVTNCSLELDGVRINLNVLDKEKLLQLLVKLNSYFLSAKAVGVETQVEYSGYKLDEWITDVSAKLSILNKKDEERQLSVMEAKLEKMLSDEKQVELELDSIADMLKD